MKLISVLAAAAATVASASTAVAWKDALTGRHLDIVVRQDKPFVTRDDSKTGNSRFTGYCINSIQQAASVLGFTYTLQEPTDKSIGSGLVDGTYKQGHDDVASGARDMYWSGYFITTQRQQAVNFTTPYAFSGLKLLGLRPEFSVSYLGRATLFAQPFESEFWWVLLAMTLYVAFAFFVIERGDGEDFSELTERSAARDMAKEGFPGFVETLLVHYPKSLFYAFNSFPASHCHNPKTTAGRIFSTLWVCFCLVIVAVYTANLAAFLTEQKVHGQIDSIEALITNRKAACTLAGTAYSDFLIDNHPSLNIIEKTNTDIMREAVMDGECEVLIDVSYKVDYMVAQPFKDECRFMIRGEPVYEGPSFLSVGVNNDDGHIRHLLSMELTDQQFSGKLDEFYETWVTSAPGSTCQFEEYDENQPLGIVHFSVLCIVLVVSGVILMIYSMIGYEYTGVGPDEFRNVVRTSGQSEIMYRWFNSPEARARIEMLLISYLRKHLAHPKLQEHIKALDRHHHDKMAKFAKENSMHDIKYKWTDSGRKDMRGALNLKSTRNIATEDATVGFDNIENSLETINENEETKTEEGAPKEQKVSIQNYRESLDAEMEELPKNQGKGSAYNFYDEIYATWFHLLHVNGIQTTITDTQYRVDLATSPTIKEALARYSAVTFYKLTGGSCGKEPRPLLTKSQVDTNCTNISRATVELLPVLVEVMRRVDPSGFSEDWEISALELLPRKRQSGSYRKPVAK